MSTVMQEDMKSYCGYYGNCASKEQQAVSMC